VVPHRYIHVPHDDHVIAVDLMPTAAIQRELEYAELANAA
jgi:hypothetical protein